jgi:hypothetical protein
MPSALSMVIYVMMYLRMLKNAKFDDTFLQKNGFDGYFKINLTADLQKKLPVALFDALLDELG